MKSDNLLLYAVTDRSWLNGHTLAWQVEEALKGGVTILQLREKELSKGDFHKEYNKEALEIQKICMRYQVPFLINDDVELACQIHADGVHVGQSDMEAAQVREKIGSEKILVGQSAGHRPAVHRLYLRLHRGAQGRDRLPPLGDRLH